MKNWTTFRYAFQKSLPVMAGYLVLGMGFGMMLEAAGYGIGWALAMSIFIYAGSMQYVVIDLLTGGASLITTALMTVRGEYPAFVLRDFNGGAVSKYAAMQAVLDFRADG